jgi:hypothetical protein
MLLNFLKEEKQTNKNKQKNKQKKKFILLFHNSFLYLLNLKLTLMHSSEPSFELAS